MQGLSPCDHEEADTRIFVHVKHAANEHSRIMIKTIDTDVVCIAISCVKRIPELEDLWVEFESGKTLQFMPILEISNALGIPVCEALPFCHSFSGCDTTSSFTGRGKKTFYDVWKIYPDITAIFRKLSKGVPEVSDEDLQHIEKCVASLYSNTCNTNRVNVARQILFTQGKCTLDNIPLTASALQQHAIHLPINGLVEILRSYPATTRSWIMGMVHGR